MIRSFIIKLTCIATAFSIIGGPLAMYQVFAWSQMLHDRIPNQGLAEAIDSTFSGETPCEHCLKISAIKKDEKQPEKNQLPKKIEVISIAKIAASNQQVSLVKPPSVRLAYIPSSIHIPKGVILKCPTPPPRNC